MNLNIGRDFELAAGRIRLLLTDCDGVLTDGGVYYGLNGEALKRFNMRDGMGVERLRKVAGIDVGIITGERSPSVIRRAEKLGITELYLGVKNKLRVLDDVLHKTGLDAAEVAYIGDDWNDLEIMAAVGLNACPADALPFVRRRADYVCQLPGGHGAFREVAELILACQVGEREVEAAPAGRRASNGQFKS